MSCLVVVFRVVAAITEESRVGVGKLVWADGVFGELVDVHALRAEVG